MDNKILNNIESDKNIQINFDESLLKETEKVFEVIAKVRGFRNEKNISPKIPLPIGIKTENKAIYQLWEDKITKLANVSDMQFVDSELENASAFVIKGDSLFIQAENMVDVEAEREKIIKELSYTKGFLESVLTKLANEKFVSNAKPDMVEKERAKQSDAEEKIKALEIALERLG
jgi:valyl-tRNA synthetase